MKRLTETIVLAGRWPPRPARRGRSARRALAQVAHRRGQDHAPCRVRQALGHAVAHRRDQRMGRAEVDADGDAALMRIGRAAGFGNLQQGHGLSVLQRARERRRCPRRSAPRTSGRAPAGAAAAGSCWRRRAACSSRASAACAIGGDLARAAPATLGRRLRRRPAPRATPSAASGTRPASRCCLSRSIGTPVQLAQVGRALQRVLQALGRPRSRAPPTASPHAGRLRLARRSGQGGPRACRARQRASSARAVLREAPRRGRKARNRRCRGSCASVQHERSARHAPRLPEAARASTRDVRRGTTRRSRSGPSRAGCGT